MCKCFVVMDVERSFGVVLFCAVPLAERVAFFAFSELSAELLLLEWH